MRENLNENSPKPIRMNDSGRQKLQHDSSQQREAVGQVEEAGQITRRRIQVKQIEQNFCFHLGRFQGGLSQQWGRPTEADAKSHSTTVPGKRFAWCLFIFFSVFFFFCVSDLPYYAALPQQ